MVRNVTSYSGSGLRDWLVQRVSAIIIALYTLFLVGFLIVNNNLSYATWETLFSNSWFKIATLLALLSLILHAWVGVWTIFTDYIKCTCLRLLLEVIVIVALVSYFAWGLLIVGSV